MASVKRYSAIGSVATCGSAPYTLQASHEATHGASQAGREAGRQPARYNGSCWSDEALLKNQLLKVGWGMMKV